MTKKEMAKAIGDELGISSELAKAACGVLKLLDLTVADAVAPGSSWALITILVTFMPTFVRADIYPVPVPQERHYFIDLAVMTTIDSKGFKHLSDEVNSDLTAVLLHQVEQVLHEA